MTTDQLDRVPAAALPPAEPAHAPAHSVVPGLALAAGGAVVALGAHRLAPALSPVFVAIVLGAIVANLTRLPRAVQPGLGIASRGVLRIGVALLGLQLVLADVLALGWPMLVVIALVVGAGITGTLALGRALGVAPGRRLLLACGFSICGAAAIAAVDGVRPRSTGDADREEREGDVAAMIALAVVFGSAAMLLVPLLGALLELAPAATGAWSGAAVHEVGQVVVAGGLIAGGAGLQTAVTVKLGRVLLLAPVLAVLSWRERRTAPTGARRPPLVPLFVAAFLGCVLLRTLVPLPHLLLETAQSVQTGALAAAMFALGCSVDARMLRRVGRGELVLATAATLLVALLALPAAYVVGQG